MSDVGNGIKQDGAWTFRSDDVAAAFDEHVAMSTPGYDDLQRLVARLSTFFARDGSAAVDYGCATGRTIAEVAAANAGRRVRYIGIDESEAMVTKARERLASIAGAEVRAAAVLASPPPSDASLLFAVYVLQFMSYRDREAALSMMRRATSAGTALFLVEKTTPDDPACVVPFYDAHHEEKMEAYSAQEVMAKARALRGVLQPMSMRHTEAMLRRAGWKPQRFWQRLAFAGWVCT